MYRIINKISEAHFMIKRNKKTSQRHILNFFFLFASFLIFSDTFWTSFRNNLINKCQKEPEIINVNKGPKDLVTSI
jgi:hypothetical protein